MHKRKGHLTFGTGDTIFGRTKFETKFPLLDHKRVPSPSPPDFNLGVVCARYPRLWVILKRVQGPALNRLCPHVSSPWDGRSMGDPICDMLLLAIFRVPFFW